MPEARRVRPASLCRNGSKIAFYNEPPIQRPSLSPDLVPLQLSQADREDLLAYLRTLTSDDRVEAPRLPQ